ncbi:hypothetical protein ACJ41O_004106 [Fusarium nematophilum]
MDGGVQGDDPFSWGVVEVVQRLSNLGAPGRPWDPTSLAAQIREHELDGRTLLTYDELYSRQELMESLGIKLARHKAIIAEAIVDLRSRSRAYRQWWQDFKRKKAGYLDSDEPETPIHHQAGPQFIPTLPDGHHQSPDSRSFPAQVNGEAANTHSPVNSISIAGTLENAKQQGLNEGHPRLDQLPSHAPVHNTGEPTQDHDSTERSAKRLKRVAPTSLDSRPRNISAAFIPTQADVISFGKELKQVNTQAFPWDEASQYAYIGGGSLTATDIKSSTRSLSSALLELDDDTFVVPARRNMPPASRMIVSKFTKQLFIENNHGRTSQRRPSSPGSDMIYRLSDLGEEDLDEETLKEMEDERRENERREALQKALWKGLILTHERVDEILDETVLAMTQAWQKTKLPKYERRAYHIWHTARRTGSKRQQIFYAHQQAALLSNRIRKIRREILANEWQKEVHVRDQAKSLQLSVEDKLYHAWLVDVLESSRPPPKPQAAPRPKRPVVQQDEDPLEEEILTSSDEDDVMEEYDFIVADDEPALGGDPMDIVRGSSPAVLDSLSQPLKEETPVSPASLTSGDYIDLTQLDSIPPSPLGGRRTAFIDLTNSTESPHPSPQKGSRPPDATSKTVSSSIGNETVVPPAIESLGDIENIRSIPPKKWVKENDRWRLLVSLLWNLEHSRRRALLDLVQSQDPVAVWNGTTELFFSNTELMNPEHLTPGDPNTVAFDLVRLFRCFSQCKNCPESFVNGINFRKLKKKLQRARGKWFSPFCEFIKELAPEFPLDSQIYRVDIFDDMLQDGLDDELDDPDDLDEDQEDEDPARPKKRRVPKEIIRDKAAVDLRDREHQRVQDQEARRKLLRATLASYDEMPREKARLIVNESKEEDQNLIYINEDIAPRIKDHQIDGVRFLWNQIVLDSSVRQGCLLAHTMGLGKTMQVISFLVALAEAAASHDPSIVAQVPEDLRKSQTLVLCPPMMVQNWMDEFLMWTPSGTLGELRKVVAEMPLEERNATVTAWSSGGGVLLIGFNMFIKLISKDELTSLLTDTPALVVVDEAHHMKNPKTRIHQAAAKFKTKARIALTGSPLANNVLEYQAMINWVAPNFLGPLDEFQKIYANPVEQGLYHDSSAYEKRRALKTLQALKQMVAPIVQRRTIAAIKADLPPKFEFILFVAPTELQKKLYELHLSGFDPLKLETKAGAFAMVNQLGLICSHPKCYQMKAMEVRSGVSSKKNRDKDEEAVDSMFPKQVIPESLKLLSVPDLSFTSFSWKTELLTIILDEARKLGDKVLIFSQSLMTLNYLESMCRLQKRNVCRLDGSTRVQERQQMIKSFNTGNKEVYLISTKAGGVGLNIQGANRVVIFDLKWNPQDVQQAVGRAYRIGQKKPVFVYRFMVAGTFEEDLNNKHVFKMQLASRVVDEKNPVSWSKRKGKLLAPIKPTPASDLEPFLHKDTILDKLIRVKENGEAIRSIVSMDTFEEEDLDVSLTAEERKEVDQMISLNHLRATNPEEYQRAKDQVGLFQQQAIPMPLQLSHRPVFQSFNGTFDLPSRVDERLPRIAQQSGLATLEANGYLEDEQSAAAGPSNQPPSRTPGPVPMPLAGANTFFGEHSRSVPSQASVSVPVTAVAANATANDHPKSPPRPETQGSIFKGGGAFNMAQIPAKVEFEKHLRERIQNLQQRRVPRTEGVPEQMARDLTEKVHAVRKGGAFGALPDTQHWKHLDELLVHDKFVIAIIAGRLSSEYVALAEKDELGKRIQTINGLEEGDISVLADRRINAPDPNV